LAFVLSFFRSSTRLPTASQSSFRSGQVEARKAIRRPSGNQCGSWGATGNSVTGKEAAEMGWVAKSFPAEALEEQVLRELRPMSQIAPDLLAANKHSVNQAYDIMGFRTALATGWQWHALSSRLRPGASEFGDAMREGGLKGALQWRDGAFKEEGFD
jgi:enoyl-CoA hydratase